MEYQSLKSVPNIKNIKPIVLIPIFMICFISIFFISPKTMREGRALIRTEEYPFGVRTTATSHPPRIDFGDWVIPV